MREDISKSFPVQVVFGQYDRFGNRNSLFEAVVKLMSIITPQLPNHVGKQCKLFTPIRLQSKRGTLQNPQIQVGVNYNRTSFKKGNNKYLVTPDNASSFMKQGDVYSGVLKFTICEHNFGFSIKLVFLQGVIMPNANSIDWLSFL